MPSDPRSRPTRRRPQEPGFIEFEETACPLKVEHALGDIGGTKAAWQAEAGLRPDEIVAALDDTLALGLEPGLGQCSGLGVCPIILRVAACGNPGGALP